MFFVFNKQKIYSYIVAMSTVIILFIVAAFFTNYGTESIEISSNVETPSIANNVNDINVVNSVE